MDWGDVVVHVMTAEQREYYALEGGVGLAVRVAGVVGVAVVDVLLLSEGSMRFRAAVLHMLPCHLQSCAADFYGAAEEVTLPFDQSEVAAVDSWTKKL